MTNSEDRPIQEITSTYFSTIVKRDVTPMTVEQLPADTLAEFNRQVLLAFGDEGGETVVRVKYLVPYILQSIDWDTYGLPFEAWQLQYYYRRERFLQKTGLRYDAFLNHQPLQKAIAALGLEPEPTFEFILFLKYYYGMRSELHYSPLELLKQAQQALADMPGDQSASMDISVGGKHYKITNAQFVKTSVLSIDSATLTSRLFTDIFSEGGCRDKVRAIDYYIVKTLLDYLPIHIKRTRTGHYTQEERNFGLSVLSFIGRLPDIDRIGVCSYENNATFDKLMRDFKSYLIPFAMELFL